MSFLFAESGALFSPCELYRYELWRQWAPGTCQDLVFCGLNPSTADALVNDPTINRCIGFAKAWGYNGFTMLNLFAWRATDPKDMQAAAAPVGPDNDATLAKYLARPAVKFVAAWGALGDHQGRDQVVCRLVRAAGRPMWCLGHTAAGLPRHPLYISADTKLVPYFAP